MKISVVIPTLDEERQIESCLRQFNALEGKWELIVADGGSRDRTLEILSSHPEVVWISGGGHRGYHLNRGAERATGEVLLFLHCDVRLPQSAYQDIRKAMEDERTVGGAFRTWTVRDHSQSRTMALALHLADGRSRYTSLPYGDQGIFVRRDSFQKVGGYNEALPLLEDLDFSRRLRGLGRIATMRSSVRVSGRRFERGPIRYTFWVNAFPFLYRLGVSPDWMARRYESVR